MALIKFGALISSLTDFFSSAVQLIGITVTGLESEFQPIFNYLLPHIISSKQDDNDMHLQVEDTASATFLAHINCNMHM